MQIGFRKLLNSWTGALSVLAIVIGAGIYSVPQKVAQYSDTPAMMLSIWITIGLLCLGAALVWAELAARLPYAGSDYLALHESFGRYVAFLYGWRSLVLSSPSNRAALALIAAEYTAVLFPGLVGFEVWLGIGLIFILGVINIKGLAYANIVNVGSASVKSLALLLFVILVFIYGDPESGINLPIKTEPIDEPILGRLALAALLVFFSYVGWGRIAIVAEEFKDPRIQLAKSMVLSMTGAILLYVLVNAAYVYALGMDGMRASSAVGSASMDIVFGGLGAAIFAVLVIVSVVGSMSTSIMSCGRLYFAMARKGTFFQFFDHLHAKSRVPNRALWIHVFASITMLVLRQNFVDLVTSAVFIEMIFFVFRISAIFFLRKRRIGDETEGFRIPFYPVLPIVILIFMMALLVIRVFYDWDRAWFDLLILAIGIPASILWFRLRDKGIVQS